MVEARSKAGLIPATVLLLFSFVYTLSAFSLKIGRLSSPGPGLMPLLLGLGLFVCALVYLLQQARRDPQAPPSWISPGGWHTHRLPLGIILQVAAYPFLLPWLGFLPATGIVVYSMLLLLRFKTPWVSLLVCIVMTLCCYLLFARLLGVVLPVGPAEQILFRWF
jgi:putative tricarboxylic transport membrane protein